MIGSRHGCRTLETTILALHNGNPNIQLNRTDFFQSYDALWHLPKNCCDRVDFKWEAERLLFRAPETTISPVHFCVGVSNQSVLSPISVRK